MKQIALLTVTLEASSVFALAVALGSGKGGSWALPAFLAVAATIAIVGLVLLARAQRAQIREH